MSAIQYTVDEHKDDEDEEEDNKDDNATKYAHNLPIQDTETECPSCTA